jgi:hypothetical protein
MMPPGDNASNFSDKSLMRHQTLNFHLAPTSFNAVGGVCCTEPVGEDVYVEHILTFKIMLGIERKKHKNQCIIVQILRASMFEEHEEKKYSEIFIFSFYPMII